MAQTPTLGAQCKVSVNGTALVGWSTMKAMRTVLEREGTRGTLQHDVDDTAAGPTMCEGAIICNPSNTILASLSQLGNNSATEFAIVVDKGQATNTYSNCHCDSFSISGSQGGLIQCTLNVVGKAESAAGSVSEPTEATPLDFTDVTATIQGSEREITSFDMTINHAIDRGYFVHASTLADVHATDRVVTLNTEHPYSSNTSSLYGEGHDGATGSLVISGSTYTFGILQVDDENIPVQQKGPIPLQLRMTARKTGSTPDCAVT